MCMATISSCATSRGCAISCTCRPTSPRPQGYAESSRRIVMSKTPRSFLPLNVAVLTLSDTRTRENDTSGDLIEDKLTTAGHKVVARTIVREDLDKLRGQFETWVNDSG